MPSQNDIHAPSAPATPAPPTTPTANAKPAVTATTSNASRFTSECILLILSSTGTVHPVINKPGGLAGIRIFEDAEAAMIEHQSNPRLANHQMAVLPLKDLF